MSSKNLMHLTLHSIFAGHFRLYLFWASQGLGGMFVNYRKNTGFHLGFDK